MAHIADTGMTGACRLIRTRVSRHYYDVAVITATEVGQSALVDTDLLDAVRKPQTLSRSGRPGNGSKKRFPDRCDWVPQAELRAVIEQDYRAMQGMILGEAPGLRMGHGISFDRPKLR